MPAETTGREDSPVIDSNKVELIVVALGLLVVALLAALGGPGDGPDESETTPAGGGHVPVPPAAALGVGQWHTGRGF
jgi:hypothetical protein